MDFMGTYIPTATQIENRYILVATGYCTKWVKAKLLCNNTAKSTSKFLYENIWYRFGCRIELVSNQGKHFVNNVITGLTQHYAVIHKRSTPYYLWATGLAESTNKKLKGFLWIIINP